MKRVYNFLIAVSMLHGNYCLSQKVQVTNHRIIKNPATIMMSEEAPGDILSYRIADYTGASSITVRDLMQHTGHSSMIFGDVILLNQSIRTSTAMNEPTAMIMMADTIKVSGNLLFDLSKNRQNKEGSFGLICRVLQFTQEARLNILLGSGTPKKSSFFVLTEKVFLDDEKVFRETEEIKKRIVTTERDIGVKIANMKIFSRSTAVNKPNTINVPTRAPASVLLSRITICDNLGTALRPLPQFSQYFSQWIVAMHEKMYGVLVRNANDQYAFAEQYVKIKGFLPYEILGSYTGVLNAKRAMIMELVNNTFRNSASFTRKEVIGGKTYNIISMINDSRIDNFLLPDITLIPPFSDSVPRLGYFIPDLNDQHQFSLEFDIVLGNDPAAFNTVQQHLAKKNQVLKSFCGDFPLTELYLEGAGIAADQSTISTVNNNYYKVHLVSPLGNSLLFHKLFSGVNSDIIINGRFESLPVRIPLTLNRTFSAVEGETGDTTSMVNITLDPERYGDYFEQIDAGDQLTQTLLLFNNVSSIPRDSLSGNMVYVELILTYNDGVHVVRKTINMLPANSAGDRSRLEIIKKGKEYIPISISGTVYYENGKYIIQETTLNDGAVSYHITDELLKDQNGG